MALLDRIETVKKRSAVLYSGRPQKNGVKKITLLFVFLLAERSPALSEPAGIYNK